MRRNLNKFKKDCERGRIVEKRTNAEDRAYNNKSEAICKEVGYKTNKAKAAENCPPTLNEKIRNAGLNRRH